MRRDPADPVRDNVILVEMFAADVGVVGDGVVFYSDRDLPFFTDLRVLRRREEAISVLVVGLFAQYTLARHNDTVERASVNSREVSNVHHYIWRRAAAGKFLKRPLYIASRRSYLIIFVQLTARHRGVFRL